MFNQCFISVSKVFQKCFENDSKVFVSLSVLKLFVRIEVIAATRALGGLVLLNNIFEILTIAQTHLHIDVTTVTFIYVDVLLFFSLSPFKHTHRVDT